MTGDEKKTTLCASKYKNAHPNDGKNCVKTTLWNSGVLTVACLPGSYRFSEFRDGNTVGEGVAVTGVVHQNARQEHGAQVVSVQDVHGQSGGGSSSVRRVRSAVLGDVEMLLISTFKLHRQFVDLGIKNTDCLR